MSRSRTLPALLSPGVLPGLTGCGLGSSAIEAPPASVVALYVALCALACCASFAAGWLAARLRDERSRREVPPDRQSAEARETLPPARSGAHLPHAPMAPARAADCSWLEALSGPALVALPGPDARLSVIGLNRAAQRLWPGVAGGHDALALGGLPASWPALAAEVAAAPGGPAEAPHTLESWRITRLTWPPPRGALLLHRIDQAQEPEALSSTLSHDLRAPIRVVEGFTRIIKEDYGGVLDRVGNDHLDRVLAATSRMNLMIDALLTMARLSAQPLTRRPVDMSHLAAQVIDELRRGGPEREVAVQIEPGLTTSGDPTLLRLVLENLLGNAWKYTARSDAPRITLSGERVNGAPAFVVADNGAGFDMRAAERLFGLFQRLHSAADFPGHGVGLASVRRIVRRHGGEVWAEAQPGRGARFTFTLP